ncbi:MAG: hypothetical protein F7B17_03255 [Desulfurococcales archaeon]|nr:hypothetical protein [Desulfurococcales archaeon]
MVDAKTIAIVGGVLSAISSLISMGTAEPTISHLLKVIGLIQDPLIQGTIVQILGVIGIIGSAGVIYFANKGDGVKTMVSGFIALLAPCGLAILAIIGGYLMTKQK